MRKSELELGTEYAIATYQGGRGLPSASKAELIAINPSRDEWPEAELRDPESRRTTRKQADGSVNVTVCLVEYEEPRGGGWNGKGRKSRRQLRTSRHVWSTWKEYEEAEAQEARRRKADREMRARRTARREDLRDRITALLGDDAGYVCEYSLGSGLGLDKLERLIEMAEGNA